MSIDISLVLVVDVFDVVLLLLATPLPSLIASLPLILNNISNVSYNLILKYPKPFYLINSLNKLFISLFICSCFVLDDEIDDVDDDCLKYLYPFIVYSFYCLCYGDDFIVDDTGCCYNGLM